MGYTDENGKHRMSNFGMPKKEVSGAVESIRIEPGKNGFAVHVQRRPKPSKLDEPMRFEIPKPEFYSDVDGVVKCIKSNLEEPDKNDY